MSKEQFLEMTSLDVRRRNWSTSSCESDLSNTKPLYGNKEIIYHDLKEEDTLQNLALKYNCKQSEIKHANKLYQEKELHALRTIKIPVVKDGVLHNEYLKQQSDQSNGGTHLVTSQLKASNNGDNKPEDNFYGDRKDKFKIQTKHQFNPDLDFLPTSDDEDDDIFDRQRSSDRTPLLPTTNDNKRTILIGQPIDNCEPTLSDFIERVDIRIQHEIKNVNTQKEDMDKVVDALLSPVVFPADRKVTTDTYGSACYFSWKFWLVLLCLIAVVVPLLYFLHFRHN
ncbi:lysM and putative peptidoglycan-binding domain-containing protein 3-like [Clytia hemisphaerica]